MTSQENLQVKSRIVSAPFLESLRRKLYLQLTRIGMEWSSKENIIFFTMKQ